MENTRARAEALLATRLDAIDALTTAHEKEDDLRGKLRDAEAETAAAWVAASAAGWSDKELTKLGFARPAVRRTRRPRTTTTNRRETTGTDTASQAHGTLTD